MRDRDENDVLRLSDIFLSAYLILRVEIQPTFSQKGDRVIFEFPKSSGVYAALSEYHADNAVISASEFAATVKKLKGEMYTFKAQRDKCAP